LSKIAIEARYRGGSGESTQTRSERETSRVRTLARARRQCQRARTPSGGREAERAGGVGVALRVAGRGEGAIERNAQ